MKFLENKCLNLLKTWLTKAKTVFLSLKYVYLLFVSCAGSEETKFGVARMHRASFVGENTSGNVPCCMFQACFATLERTGNTTMFVFWKSLITVWTWAGFTSNCRHICVWRIEWIKGSFMRWFVPVCPPGQWVRIRCGEDIGLCSCTSWTMPEDHFLRGNTLFVTTWCEFRLLSSFASMDQNRNDDQLPINTIIAIPFCANPLLHPQNFGDLDFHGLRV